mmetsp:Transcript_111369/g.315023  ORF Transcript_111369/g.315023 Transcript_111369/m.315023 type:complete len:337 (+) Transcript_111369:562-1572(+)
MRFSWSPNYHPTSQLTLLSSSASYQRNMEVATRISISLRATAHTFSFRPRWAHGMASARPSMRPIGMRLNQRVCRYQQQHLCMLLCRLVERFLMTQRSMQKLRSQPINKPARKSHLDPSHQGEMWTSGHKRALTNPCRSCTSSNPFVSFFLMPQARHQATNSTTVGTPLRIRSIAKSSSRHKETLHRSVQGRVPWHLSSLTATVAPNHADNPTHSLQQCEWNPCTWRKSDGSTKIGWANVWCKAKSGPQFSWMYGTDQYEYDLIPCDTPNSDIDPTADGKKWISGCTLIETEGCLQDDDCNSTQTCNNYQCVPTSNPSVSSSDKEDNGILDAGFIV